MAGDPRQAKAAAKALRAAIIAQLRDSGPMAAEEMAAAVGCEVQTARNYVCRLVKAGIARVERIPGTTQDRSVIAKYHFVSEVCEKDSDSNQRKVIIRKEWEPYHRRMPMDCYLFGSAGMEVA